MNTPTTRVNLFLQSLLNIAIILMLIISITLAGYAASTRIYQSQQPYRIVASDDTGGGGEGTGILAGGGSSGGHHTP